MGKGGKERVQDGGGGDEVRKAVEALHRLSPGVKVSLELTRPTPATVSAPRARELSSTETRGTLATSDPRPASTQGERPAGTDLSSLRAEMAEFKQSMLLRIVTAAVVVIGAAWGVLVWIDGRNRDDFREKLDGTRDLVRREVDLIRQDLRAVEGKVEELRQDIRKLEVKEQGK